MKNNLTKFWNVAKKEGNTAEITVYGEIVTERPKDWWTGENLEGMYSVQEELLNDLDSVKDATDITVRINSIGGDLYTAIGICNRLKELSGNVTAVIDGIAASAATIIAMGCDTIKAYSGSMFMVHEALTTLIGMYNHKDLMLVNKRLEAANSAAAETYHAKTGLPTDKIRSQMATEKWMTGIEAKENGWIDEVLDNDVEMSLCAGMLSVNGVSMSAKSFSNLPSQIPVIEKTSATHQEKTAQPDDANISKPIKEEKKMTVMELKEQSPELIEELKKEFKNELSDEVRTQAINDERARLRGIDEIAQSVNDDDLVNEAKENGWNASELALKAMQKASKQGNQYLEKAGEDFKNSGAQAVEPAPNTGNPTEDSDNNDLSEEQAVAMIVGKKEV